MSPIRTLAPDQRAVLELLLRQGRSYAELSELLGIPEDAVRSRAHAALATLAPDTPAPVGEDGAVADWILGQQDDEEAAGTREALARTPAWRAWALDVTGRLAEVEGAELPDVPDAEEHGEAAAPAPQRRAKAPAGGAAASPRRARPARDGAGGRPRPVRDGARPQRDAQREPAAAAPSGSGLPLRSSRLGGALLIGLLAALIAVVLVVFVLRGDDTEREPSQAAATATPSATPQVVNEVVMQGVGNQAQGLMRVFRRDQDGRLVFALAADNMPRNRKGEVYAVWFLKKGGAPRNLGFSQSQVGKEGVFTTGGPQEGQEADFARWLVEYDTVAVARANADTANAERPGQVVLRGTLPGGQK